MAESPTVAVVPVRSRRPFTRLILILLFTGPATYLTWRLVVAAVAHQPLYELEWTDPVTFREPSVVGPWLLVREHQRPGAPSMRIEIRTLLDGQLVNCKSLPAGNAVSHPFITVDHVDLGKDCLVGSATVQGRASLVLTQPRTFEQKTITTLPKAPAFWMASHSRNGKLWVEQRQLPLAPFSLLGTNGLPDVLAADFYGILGHDSHELGVLSVPLVRSYDLTTGKVLGEFSLPAVPGCWPQLSPTYDGSLVLESQRTSSTMLAKVLPKPRPKAAEPGSLRPLFGGFRLRDPVTGQVVWESPIPIAWGHAINAKPQGIILDTIDVLTTDYPDWSFIAQMDTQRTYRLLLHHEKRWVTLADLTDGYVLDGPGDGLVRIVSWHYEYNQDFISPTRRAIKIDLKLADFDANGQPIAQRTFSFPGAGDGAMIPGTNQVILRRFHPWPEQETLNAWLERWPFLRFLPLQASFSESVVDLTTGETHLQTMARQPTWIHTSPSPDGRYLLVSNKHHDSLQRLAVYVLPFPPLTWPQRWLPMLATGAVGTALIFLLLRRRPKPTDCVRGRNQHAKA